MWLILKLYSSIYFLDIFGSFAGIDEIRELMVIEWFIHQINMTILYENLLRLRGDFLYIFIRDICIKYYVYKLWIDIEIVMTAIASNAYPSLILTV